MIAISTEWMGRYRDLVAALVRHCNQCAKDSTVELQIDDGIVVSIVEWQILEYIIEHKNDDDRMISVAQRLGIPQSTFSRLSSRLSNLGLIEKYRSVTNRKNIILKPTELGEDVYRRNVKGGTNDLFFPFFHELDQLDDDTIRIVTDAIGVLTDTLQNHSR